MSHSSAAWLSITLLPPPTTDGIPWASNAARIGSTRLTLERSSATWPAPIGSPVVRRAGAEQPRHVGREVLGDVLAQRVDPDRAVAAGREAGGPELTQAQRCADRCADQPALPVVRLDVEHRDLRVAELGAAGQRLERVDQAGVAAPVGGEGVPGGGGAGSAEVGDDVAAAEGVDRLLRVADQDQRGVPR